MSVKTFVNTLICGLALTTSLSIGAQSFSLDQVNEHILKLRGLKSVANKADTSEMLKSLRQSENYAQALTEYLIQDYEDNGVDAYTLNLVHEFLSYQISVHEKIDRLSLENENLLLKSFQLLTIKKIDDLFFSNTGLRAIYKDQINATPYGLAKWVILRDKILSKEYVKQLQAEVKESYFPLAKINTESLTEQNKEVVTSFEESSLYKDLINQKNWDNTLLSNHFWANFSDNTADALGTVTTGASAAFGAVAGNIAWREGYLRDDKNLLDYVLKTVRPFDLLMEKKAYKFTDLTIPGHWGHIGVYLGTKEQLQEMGIWESPFLDPFRENIERGKTIFQVRRTGLVFDSIEDFMNLDEMAILRIKGQADKPKEELDLIFEYLSSQTQKSYDFSFDAMTGETITCTEIVAFSYGPIKWPMDYLVGRYTISPNNMAELALHTNSPLKTIAYITGDQEGTHYRSEQEFGATLEYKAFGDIYKKEGSVCKRITYRHKRTAIRFKYECEPTYTEMVYGN